MLANLGHDENYRYKGGKAGDQNNEWRLMAWYPYPWNVVLRYPDPLVRHWMGDQARAAAVNDNIGYDQGDRQTFWQELVKANYDASKIKNPCESDCSAGVLAICKAAGYHFGITALKNINEKGYTGNEQSILVSAGFEALTASKYLTSDKYLDNGDILLNTKNHTAFNVTKGAYCDANQGADTAKTELAGVDVSEHNGAINWEKAKEAVNYAIIRCGYGSDDLEQDDKYWEKNSAECEKVGIPYGVYLYSYALTEAQAHLEANHVLRLIKGKSLRLPVYFDSEYKPQKAVAKKLAEIFIADIRKAGYRCGVYASESWYKSYMYGIDCDSLWIGKYGTDNGKPQTKPSVGTDYDMWQYTSVGRIPGSNHDTDMNIMYNNIIDGSSPAPVNPAPAKPVPNITYAVKTAKGKIYSGQNGEAVGDGQKIVDIKVGSDYGSMRYRVHCGGRWLPCVTGNDWNDYLNGYAGDDKNPIDAIQIYYTSDRNKTEVYEVEYAVKPIGYSGYLPKVYDTNWEAGDGDHTAGVFKKPFGYIEMRLVRV